MAKSVNRFIVFSVLVFTLVGLQACATLFDAGDDQDRDPASVAKDGSDSQNCDTGECVPHHIRNKDFGIDPQQIRVKQAVDARDVILGMSRNEVLQSWGEPAVREVAGTGGTGHERWHYGARYSLQGERVVIFESGRVAGWYR